MVNAANEDGLSYAQLHAEGIGSAEIAAVVGMDPYLSNLELYDRKRRALDGVPEPAEDERNWHADRGVFLEAGGLAWVVHRTGIPFEKMPSAVRRGPAIVRPDGFAVVGDQAIVAEIKFPSAYSAMHDWGPDGTGADGVPRRALLQNVWQQGACDATAGVIGAFVDSLMRVYRVPFPAELWATLRLRAEEFMDHVRRGVPPKVLGSDAAADYLKSKYPKHDEDAQPLQSTPELDDVVREYLDAREVARANQDAADALANVLKQQIGDRPGLLGSWGRIRWAKNRDTVGVRWEELARELLLGQTEERRKEWLEKFTGVTRAGARPFTYYPAKKVR